MPDPQPFYFASRSLSWAFMRACAAAGIAAGYPSLKVDEFGRYRVLVDGSKSEAALDIYFWLD